MMLDQMRENCHEVAGLLKHFSHPQRLLILCYLSEGERTVSEIQEAAGLSQSQTSQFLKRMEAHELVCSRREGNHSYYAVQSPDVLKLLKAMKKIFC